MRETKLWTWHIITAVIVLVFLGLHMAIQHLDLIWGYLSPAEGRAIEWDNVLFRMKSMFFAVTYIVLLGAALYHGLYGLRTIIFELNPGKSLKKFVTVMLWLGGAGLFVFGTYAAVAAKMLADKI